MTPLVTRRAVLKNLGSGADALAVLPLLSEEGLAAFAEIRRTQATPRLKVLSPAPGGAWGRRTWSSRPPSPSPDGGVWGDDD